jgi:hypothetical protein
MVPGIDGPLCHTHWRTGVDTNKKLIAARRAASPAAPRPLCCPECDGQCECQNATPAAPDPYEQHRVALAEYGITEVNLHEYPNAPERQATREAARLRNIAALSAELREPTSIRKARLRLQERFGAREGIDDVGGFSSQTWEE